MPLSRIKLPADDARLITYEDTVYKLKLTYDRDNASAFLPCSGSQLNHQVEQILRAVIYANPADPLKIKTEHFYADCSFSEWQALRLIAFKKDNLRLDAHPQVISIKLTPHGLHNELTGGADERSAKRHKSNEEGSTRRTRSPPRAYESSSIAQEDEQTHGQRTEGDRSEHRVYSTESENRTSTHQAQHRDLSTHMARERREMQEGPQVVENVGRKKKAHRPPLQFVEAPLRLLRVDMGDRLSEDQLQTHYLTGSGDHVSRPRKSPRLTQAELGPSGEGVHVILRKSPRLSMNRQSRTSPRTSRSELRPSGSHSMMTRHKRQSPQQEAKKRRRSSLGKMIESFLDHFW